MKTQVVRVSGVGAVCFLVVAMVAGTATAEPPWKKLVPFKSVDADPGTSYWLSEKNGPWLILATSFAGPGAQRDAHELVMELRKEFDLEAYMHKRHYDFSEPVYGRGVNRYGGPKKMQYKSAASFDEFAVLVGNYPSVDAPRAKEELEKVKSIRPVSLLPQGEKKKETTQRFAVLRELQRLVNMDPDVRKSGPMRRAFIARNPLLPKEYFVGSGVDSLVLEMNDGVKHTLLDCTGKFTVRVATFRGESHFVGEGVKKEDDGGLLPDLPGMGKPSKLELAADKAHRLTEMLREQGVEAYEFHDRFESYVTVGSFDSIGNRMQNGRINLQPQIFQIMKKYGAQRSPLPGQSQGLVPKTMGGIRFDVQPLPVVVPRRSISSDYAAGNHKTR